MNPGKQIKFDYSTALLRRALAKEEKDLEFWNAVIDKNSDFLAERQARGNISGTRGRITELNSAINLLDPPREEPIKS